MKKIYVSKDPIMGLKMDDNYIDSKVQIACNFKSHTKIRGGGEEKEMINTKYPKRS